MWTHAFGSSFSKGLAGSALVYDTTRRQIIRYGGVTTPFEDPPGVEIPYFDRHTYEWRASSWVDSLATNGPGLYGIGMAFDQRRGLAVIVGGFGTIDEADRTDHTWEYTDRVGWRDLGPTLPGRGYPAMAYDSKRGRLVVVGGDGGQGNTAIEHHPDLGWVQLPPFPHFGRAGAGMAYDSRREKMVFMGGAGAGETWDDTWELETIPMNLTLIAPPPGTVLCQENPPTLHGQTTDGRSLAYQWLLNGFARDGATNLSFTLPTNLWEGPVAVQLKATDLCGNVFLSAETNLFIHTPPRIFYDHSDRFLCPGDSLVVPTTIQSTLEPVSYQWFFNGTAIDLATHATLSLQTLARENTGTYLLRARNACGDTFSQEMHVQVGVAISRQPANAVADVCQTAGFSVGARGVGMPRYQWRLDGVPLANDAYFSGATTSNLIVRPCLYACEGNYDVVITDGCGALHSVTSRVATLTIKPGPEWVLRATNGPPARSSHAMAYDRARKVTVLFGGWQTNGSGAFVRLGDLWEWNGARWLQRLAHSPSNGWTFNAQSGWRPAHVGQPVNRRQHGFVHDSRRGRCVLFGGETTSPDGFQMFLNDVWEWDGASWHFRTTDGPAPRANAGMAYDSQRGVTVMTGGFVSGPDPTPGAVWEWDGTAWQRRDPTNGPPTNYSQDFGAMAYDSFRRVTIFGPTAELDSSPWVFRAWNGATWTKVFAGYIPQFWGLRYGDLAFDSYRRRSVWFGGQFGAPSGETGFFDGQSWSVLTYNPTPPAPRFNQAMAYDAGRHATVMFGGETGAQHFNGQTWELIALDVPLINDQPASQYRQAGETAAFTVTARGPAGLTLNFQWHRNGAPLADGGRVSGAQTPTLNIAQVSPSDAGAYTVEMRNACGVTTSLPAILTLNAGLEIFNAADTVTLIWSDPGVVLQQADTVDGPWTVVPGATSPFHPAVGPAKFFRLASAP